MKRRKPSDNHRSEHDSHSLPELIPPLRLAWTTALESNDFVWATPFVHGQRVAVRCGNVVAGLRLGDGDLRWSRRVGIDDSGGKQFAATDRFILSSFQGPRGNAVVALAWTDGAELWNERITGTVVDDGIIGTERAVYVITTDEAHTLYRLRELNAETGEESLNIEAPSGASRLVVVDDQVFLASGSLVEDAAGLYVFDPDDEQVLRITGGMVGAVAASAESLVIARQPKLGEAFEIVAITIEDFSQRWTARSHEYAVAVDGGQVAYLEPSGRQGGNRATLRDERTGDVIWQGGRLPEEGIYLYFSGDAVCVHDETGMTFLDRASGREMSRLDSPKWPFSWGGAVLPGRLVLGHGNEVLCYVTEQVRAGEDDE